MTVPMPPEKVRCAVCGRESEQQGLASTNTMGPPDLDLRPAEMMRSTMDMWVQRCPHCGYRAEYIAEETEGAAEFMRGEAYKRLSDDAAYPGLARDFLCASALSENAGNYAYAGWAALYAAWACDDARKDERAVECRERAARLFLLAREKGQQLAKDAGAGELMVADVLRRCGRFEEARKLCEEGLRKGPNDFIRKLIVYERDLAASGDRRCHNAGEVLPKK